MKRISVFLCLLISACGATAFLWETVIDGEYRGASIYEIDENNFRLASLTDHQLIFQNLEGNGDVGTLLEVPVAEKNSLSIFWFNENEFALVDMLDRLAFGNINDGILWQLDDAYFQIILGDNAVLYKQRVAGTVSGNMIVYGSGYLLEDNVKNKMAYFLEIDKSGAVVRWNLDSAMSSVKVAQILDDSIIVEWFREIADNGNYRDLQKFDLEGNVVFEMSLYNTEKFAFAVNDRYLISKVENGISMGTMYSWEKEALYDMSLPYLTSSIELSTKGELLITHRSGFEIRSLEGELLSYANADTNGLEIKKIRDNGANLIVLEKDTQTFGGVVLDTILDENTIGLDVGGKLIEKTDITYQINSPTKAEQRIIKQSSSVETILLSECSLWCKWERGYAFKPGICEVFDAHLMEDGGLISVTAHCDEQGQRDQLLVHRY